MSDGLRDVLSLKWDVEVVMLLYLLSDGRRLKRLCAGCEGSAMIFFAYSTVD